MAGLDERFFLFLNALVGRWPAFDRLMGFIVNDYFVMLLLSFFLLGLWFWGETPEKRFQYQSLVLWTVGAIALTSVVVKLLNISMPVRERPFVTYPDVSLLFYRPLDPSFPSNSAAICFAMATGIWLGHRKAGALAFALAIVFGFSRTYAGVHYPGDIVGGAALGSVSAYASFRSIKALKRLPCLVINFLRILRMA